MSDITKARRLLNLLSEKKLEGVASLLRECEGFTKKEMIELANYFDHSIPYSGQHQFKLILVQRKAGNIRTKGIAENKAFETGRMVARQLRHNLNKGEPENILKAVGDVLQAWNDDEHGKAPAEKTLRRNYYYYKETCSLNIHAGSYFQKLKFPKLKKVSK